MGDLKGSGFPPDVHGIPYKEIPSILHDIISFLKRILEKVSYSLANIEACKQPNQAALAIMRN